MEMEFDIKLLSRQEINKHGYPYYMKIQRGKYLPITIRSNSICELFSTAYDAIYQYWNNDTKSIIFLQSKQLFHELNKHKIK